MRNPTPVPFGEWRPDIALLDTQFASEAENVYPGTNSYKPFKGLLPFNRVAFGDTCCGLTSARDSDGNWQIYAGTDDNLFKLDGTAWTGIGGASAPYNVPAGELWQFRQFGKLLIAVSSAAPPQYIDVDAGGSFADLGPVGHGPPMASNVHIINGFVVLSGFADGQAIDNTSDTTTPRTIIWSQLEHPELGWTIGTGLCDLQHLPDGGPVMGVSGSEIGYVLQDRNVRTIQFLPGDTTTIFSVSRVLSDRGCISRYGHTSIGNVLYFLAEDGFYAVSGQQVIPIGADRVNDWFLAHSDEGKRDRVLAFSVVDKPRICWAFHSANSSQAYYDRLIIYDWSNQRWSHVIEQAQVWSVLASVGVDLDHDHPTETGDSDLDSTANSLDSFLYRGGRPKIGAMDENGLLSSLDGDNLAATMETVERHLAPGMRAFVSETYPLEDGGAGAEGSITVGSRERVQDPVVWQTPAAPIEINGSAATFSSARLHRFRRSIPAGASWTHSQGVLVEAQQDGSLA